MNIINKKNAQFECIEMYGLVLLPNDCNYHHEMITKTQKQTPNPRQLALITQLSYATLNDFLLLRPDNLKNPIGISPSRQFRPENNFPFPLYLGEQF